jgi:predicted ATPase
MENANKLTFSNIGLFDCENEIMLSDLTVICGMNDSGKTTIAKLLYMLIKLQKINLDVDWVKEFKSTGTRLVNTLLAFEKNFALGDLNINLEQIKQELISSNEDHAKKIFAIVAKYHSRMDEIYFYKRDFFYTSDIFKDIITIMKALFEQYNEDDSEINDFLREISEAVINFLVDVINIFKMFYQSTTRNKFPYGRILDAADSFKDILAISKDNKFDESKIYEQIMKPKVEKCIVDLFEGTNNMMSKYSAKKEAYFKLNINNDEIGVNFKNKLIDNFWFYPLFSINDVTYCENLADNFMGDNFRSHYRRDDSGFSVVTGRDLYDKIEYQYLFDIDENWVSNNPVDFARQEKNKLDLIKEITNITMFENDYDIDERTFTKNKEKIHIKNVSKGIKTFQAIIKMIESNIFEEGNIVVMDEIESYLHPNFQDQFVQILMKIIKITKCKIVITTHSPIIVDALSYRNESEEIEVSYNYIETNSERTSSKIVHYEEGYELSEILSRVYRLYV